MVEPLPPVAAPDPTAHRHDGFYLRLGLGGGFMASRLEPSDGTLSASGGGLAIEFALGGTVADGLVIGGGLYASTTGAVKWKGDSLGSGSVSGGQGSLGLLGVLVDYYPDPKEGFHVQGALGIGTLSFDQDKHSGVPSEKWTGGGGGAMLGVGYEFWVGSQWSIGGIARVLLVSGSLRAEDNASEFSGKGYAPSLLFIATHH